MISRKVVAALVAVVFASPVVLPSKTNANCGAKCQERVWRKACSQKNPRACVERAILTHKISSAGKYWLRHIPRCESGYNPLARNPSGAAGLYQFIPSTWATTPYGRRNVFRAKWNALAAAWMWKVGRAPYEWECRL